MGVEYWALYKSFSNGGSVIVSTLEKPDKKKLKTELDIAVQLAEIFGWEIVLLPELTEEDARREVILPGVRRNKNPDYRINGIYGDLKTAESSSNYTFLRSKIKEALKQGDIAIVKLLDNPSSALLSLVARSILAGERRLQKIVFINEENDFFLFEKNQAGL